MPASPKRVPLPLPVPVPPPTNPFVNLSPPLTPLDYVKLAITGTTLLPIRMTLTLINIGLIGLVCWVATLGMSRADLEAGPMPTWRRVLRAPMWPLMRLQLFLFGFQWVEVEGAPAPRSVAPVMIANHTTFADPVLLMLRHGATAVSRKENGDIPVVGGILKALQTIFVDRAGSKAGRSAVKEQIRARARNDAMPPLLIFPEATCTNGKAIISFKMGAFAPLLPVQPVVISYPDSGASFDPCWVDGGPGLLAIVCRVMMQLHTRMVVRYLPPIAPPPPPPGVAEGSSEHAAAFARQAQLALAAAKGVPATQHSFLDVILSGRALKMRYPPGAAVPELGAFREVLGIDVDDAKSILARFVEADRDRDGTVSRAEWLDMFEATTARMPAEDARRHRRELSTLFDMLDQSEDGALDFREFMLGLAVLHGKAKAGSEATLRTVFRAVAGASTAHLDAAAFESLAKRAFGEVDAAVARAAFDEARAGAAGVSEDAFVSFLQHRGELVSQYRQALLGIGELRPVAAETRKDK